ncbi:MAG: N-acetylglucosamine-6-phosphate deacetylase [Lachnospiraceae bacterium]|nr:N-acetylglucosamine-6-phosphate deacetylase [Lachnospiraceae bacterium]
MRKRFENGRIFTTAGTFVPGGFSVENHVFTEVHCYAPGEREQVCNGISGDAEDLQGACVIPGLIDLHVHGALGADATDGDPEGIRRMAKHLFDCGVTAFLPTTVTAPIPVLKQAIRAINEVKSAETPEGEQARILGVHLEGPYFSKEKKGAQNPEYLKAPDLGEFRSLQELSGHSIRLVALAPELPGAEAFIREASKETVVSVAHTNCTHEEAGRAFENGASHLTHLFNAMPGLHHRAPGPIPAAAERPEVFAELISDGIHVDPAMVRLAFRLFQGRICLISDALRAEGLSDGFYDLGGLKVVLSGQRATLEDGTIAGSVTNLMNCVKRAVSFGVPAGEALLAATLNPARSLGIGDRFGSIEPGKAADFVLLDGALNRIRTVRA